MRVSRSNNAMRDVLAFLMRHWRREAWLVTGVAAAMLGATLADLFMPVFAGRLVDAVAAHAATSPDARLAAVHAALRALEAMAVLGAALVAGRFLSLYARWWVSVA